MNASMTVCFYLLNSISQENGSAYSKVVEIKFGVATCSNKKCIS